MPVTYLDSSAIVKLAVEEPESTSLRRHLRRRRPLATSALAHTEVLRALLFEDEDGLARGRAVLARLEVIRLSDRILNAAGRMLPPDLRSLDAIHLATARELGTELSHVVSYDERMLGAARTLGIRTSSPG